MAPRRRDNGSAPNKVVDEPEQWIAKFRDATGARKGRLYPKAPTPPAPAIPFLAALGYARAELVDRLGLPESIADAAMSAADEDTVVRLAERNEGWVGLILLDLATGESIESIIEKLQLTKPKSGGDEDDDIIESFHQPAAQAQFAFIDDQDELRRVIEAGDFGAWRIFLHPEQRKYVEKDFSGPFRLSGGAGTGKTVVLVHRARDLARRDPKARIVLTTFTTNLADALRDNLSQLDPQSRRQPNSVNRACTSGIRRAGLRGDQVSGPGRFEGCRHRARRAAVGSERTGAQREMASRH